MEFYLLLNRTAISFFPFLPQISECNESIAEEEMTVHPPPHAIDSRKLDFSQTSQGESSEVARLQLDICSLFWLVVEGVFFLISTYH